MHGVIGVIGQQQIARKVDLDAIALADRDRGQDVQKAVQDFDRGIRKARAEARAGAVERRTREIVSGSGLGDSAENADRQRRTEDLEVMVVNLVAKSRFADLIETLELVEAHRVTVRHHEAVKKDGEALLAEGFDFFRFAKDFGSGGDEKVLAVV